MKPGRLVLPIVMLFAAAAAGVMADPQGKGRYKQEGNVCVWNETDSGPNQCAPVTEGRFKKDGDGCVWDGSGRGTDQCTPKSGRFKQEGNRCVWTPSDNGPNQCNPRQVK